MGHAKKTARRGLAIQRNSERVRVLASETKAQLAVVGKASKQAAERLTILGERLDVLEDFMDKGKTVMIAHEYMLRPWWRRAYGWVLAGWRFTFRKASGAQAGVTVTEAEDDGVIVLDEPEVEGDG